MCARKEGWVEMPTRTSQNVRFAGWGADAPATILTSSELAGEEETRWYLPDKFARDKRCRLETGKDTLQHHGSFACHLRELLYPALA